MKAYRASFSLAVAMLAAFSFASDLWADVTLGTSFDFQDGTTQGWAGGSNPSNVTDGGPNGAGDSYLQIGGGRRFAAFNLDLSGVLDPSATSIQVDLNRPSGESDFDLRVVLFGPGDSNRWTSSQPTVVPGNGLWDTYEFSLLEADLTQVQGSASYADLVGDLNRIMFRYDPGEPSANGEFVPGTLGLDNILVVGDTGGVPGDINGDGSVDLLDLDILGANFGASPATLEQGDLNGDNSVDLLDLDILGASFGTSTAIPEPSAALLLVGAFGCGLLRRR